MGLASLLSPCRSPAVATLSAVAAPQVAATVATDPAETPSATVTGSLS